MMQRIYIYLKENWNKSLALISLVGVLIFNFIPNAENYYKLFIFIGANAVVWTMIEIKSLLDTKSNIGKYPNMRYARNDIIKSIKEEIEKNKRKQLEIEIIGGRIRTISDMIREIKDDFVSQRLNGKNVTFKVYTLKPEFLKNWDYTDIKNNVEKKEKFIICADMISNSKIELESFNSIRQFKENNIKIEIHYYRYIPHIYAYLIGKKKLFFGFFTWDVLFEELVGPDNVCYSYIDGEDNFHEYYDWIKNQTEFIKNSIQ